MSIAMTCPACGKEYLVKEDLAGRAVKCSCSQAMTIPGLQDARATRVKAKGADEKFCESCGHIIKQAAELCPKCGVRQKVQSFKPNLPSTGGSWVVPKQPPANPMLAAVLNWLWGGVGYFYIGQTSKGIVFSIVSLLLYSLDLMTCGLGLAIHAPIVLGLIIDAAIVANRLEKQEPVGEWRFF